MLQLRLMDTRMPIFNQLGEDLTNPSSAVASPHLFSRLAVPNLCAA